jgi:uncharacterized phage protein gp47/JayE
MSDTTTSPTAAYVDAYGIHAPAYSDIVTYLNNQFMAIYGSDIVITADSQDGQLIGVLASAINDTNSMAIAVYNNFSPSTAQGVGLSSMVKINGMTRQLPSNSSAPLTVIGVAGTTIVNGQVQDLQDNLWDLPASVIIPPSGEITVTVTADQPGAITAPANTITQIYTVTNGWQTATNPEAATPGAPVEDDAQLRMRQSQSTALAAQSVLDGIIGAVLALPGVTSCKGYENDTSTDYTTTSPPAGQAPLPPHSIGLVVQGGDAQQICDTILLNKTPGCYTAGTTRETTLDIYGLPHDIGFYIPTDVAVGVDITLNPLPGYTSLIGADIQAAVAAYINGLGSGVNVTYSKLWLPANLCDAAGVPTGTTNTYDIQSMTMGTPPTSQGGGAYATTNIPISITQIATCNPSDVVITVGAMRTRRTR